jgi:selenocysteine lyase/cysteine desulfurase
LRADAAQAAGSLPIAFDELSPRTALCFTAHKGLLGPMGLGGVLVGAELELGPWREGGTGDGLSPMHPLEMPRRLEAGTLPLPAIAGLAAGIAWWRRRGPDAVRRREQELAQRLRSGLEAIPAVRLVAPEAAGDLVPLVSFRIAGLTPDEVGSILDAEFGITVRAGLHCAPEAHRRLGTLPEGAVRASIGPTTEEADVEALLGAVAELAAG